MGLFIIDRLYQSDEVAADSSRCSRRGSTRWPSPPPPGSSRSRSGTPGACSARDAALQAWETANRTAHETLLRIVESDAAGTDVSLDLKAACSSRWHRRPAFPRAPSTSCPRASPTLQIASGDKLETARDCSDLFKTLLWVLLGLAVATFAGAIALSPDRRRTVVTVGGCLMFAGIALLAIRRLAGSFVVDALADAPNAHAIADNVWAISTSLLVDVAEGAFLFGLFLVLGAWLEGRGTARDGDPAHLGVLAARAPGLRPGRPGRRRSCCSSSGGPVPWTQRLWGIVIFTVLAFLWFELVRRQTLEQFPDEAPPRMPRRVRWER